MAVTKDKKPKKPNELLRYEREKRGWSQSKVAELIGADTSMVSRWECGKRKPDHFYQEKLCNLFSKDAVELGFIASSVSKMIVETSYAGREAAPLQENGSDDMNRRQTLQLLGIAGITLMKGSPNLLSSPLWERLSKALAKSSNLDETAVNGLASITKDYWQLRTKIGYRDLLNGFMGHLETVTQLLRYSHHSSIHQRLCSLASEISQRIGSIYFDMNDHLHAHIYYTVSIEAAQEANNHLLWAIGLGKMSSLPTYQGKAQEALSYLQQAQRVASNRDMPTIHTWLAAVEAEAHAHLGNSSACLQVLDRAEGLVDFIAPEEETYGIHFDRSRLAGYKGVCFLRLQEPNLALVALKEATAFNASLSLRQESIIVADSALAYAHLREVEEACKLASQALAMGFQTKSEIVTQRIRTLRDEVKQWEALQPVKDLNTQMATYALLLS